MTDLHALIAEADERPFSGWDLTCDGRITSTTPWDFRAIVERHARQSPDLLDIGTGGGEWLSALRRRPPRTIAVEGWPPNLPIARRRLEPLGIEVLAVEGAPENAHQDEGGEGGALPFPNAAFHLVISRHEAYLAAEVRRALAPGGTFLTQQVGSGAADDYFRLFDVPAPPSAPWTLAVAIQQLTDAGFTVDDADEGFETMTFADVGALAWYLKNVPFVYPDFSIPAARPDLERLHAGGPIVVRQPLFWLKARA